MAYIVPSDVSPADQVGIHSHELETLALLKHRLSSDYTVYHSVHWSRAYEKFTVFGEVDFVIVNQAGAILLIEQKNGPLEESNGELIKRYGSTRKNPVDQVIRSRDHIIEKFREQFGRRLRLEIDYLVYCPDYRVRQLSAASIDRSRVVDASARRELAGRVDEILGAGMPDAHVRDKVMAFFQHTFRLVPDIHARRERLDERFVRLSEGLVRFIGNLEVHPFRLRVVGTAGCGKSLLAAEHYRESLMRGRKTLLLCYNRPLAEMLRERLPPGGVVNSWHGFCGVLLRKHGIELDYKQVHEDGFWMRVTEQIMGLDLPESERFETIIIDEAQEFEEIWWLVLKDCLLVEDGEVLWLEDQLRADGAGGEMPDGISVTYRARENFRSPHRIAHFINERFPEYQFESLNGIVGLDAQEQQVATPKQQLVAVDKCIKALLRQGLKPADIVILTCIAIPSSVFAGVEVLGPTPIRQFTGRYEDDGNRIYTDGELRFTSVARYQGQQSPAVILVDADWTDGDDLAARRRTMFIGMTRATLRLDVISCVVADNPIAEVAQ
jgi:hypothetical protein